MGQVNSQRENGLEQRENRLRAGNGGQQLKTEKSFISRHFSRDVDARETVSPNGSWRRERACKQNLSLLYFNNLE
jgi:hypothetical protein